MLFVLSGCSTETVNKHISAENAILVKTVPTVRQEAQDVGSIKNTIGLIVLSDHYGKDDFVRLYNADGSLWYEFTYYYDDSDGKFEYANKDFEPFAFHQDYFVLALKCVGADAERYEVVVDEEIGLKKFVKKDDPNFKLETWEEHILKVFAIDFNKQSNPLREKPNGKIKLIDVLEDATFKPVEMKGDWLKVRWNGSEDNANKAQFGWVKWKENDVILIELFYIS